MPSLFSLLPERCLQVDFVFMIAAVVHHHLMAFDDFPLISHKGERGLNLLRGSGTLTDGNRCWGFLILPFKAQNKMS